MDLSFLRMIQSMAEVERNLLFRSKKYVIVVSEDLRVDPASEAVPVDPISEAVPVDPASEAVTVDPASEAVPVDPASEAVTVVLKHPDNVIVVASPTGKAPAAAVGERRVQRLSEAMIWSLCLAKAGRLGCSIVVHEGMYINPTRFHGIQIMNFPKDFSLEIVGMENVRIVNTREDSEGHVFIASHVLLSLRNLLIHDLDGNSSAVFTYSAKVSLVDVTIHGSLYPINALKGSELSVVDSCFSGCDSAFQIRGSNSKFVRCRWTDTENPGLVQVDCRLSMTECSMVGLGIGGVYIVASVRASFHRCEFVGSNRSVNSVFESTAIHAMAGVQLFLTESSVSGLDCAVKVEDSHSEAVIRGCKVLDCDAAVRSHMNSSVLVADSQLVVNYVLGLSFNERGKVRFRRNSHRFGRFPSPLLQPEGIPDTAVICSDRNPDVLEHDFEPFAVIDVPPMKPDVSSFGATRESRAELKREYDLVLMSNQFKGMALADFSIEQIKWCVHCRKGSADKPEAKFKYCGKCQRACYCSKECQNANWRDHKLVCGWN